MDNPEKIVEQLRPGALLYDPEVPFDSSYSDPYAHATGSCWMVIGTSWRQKMSGGFWEYILLGPASHPLGPIRNESVYDVNMKLLGEYWVKIA